MSKFCVLKSTIPDEEGCAIINQDDIKFLCIVKHPRSNQEVYQVETSTHKNFFYFTEFVTKESNLQEAIEYYHHEIYKSN